MVSPTAKKQTKWFAPMPLWAENSSLGVRVRNPKIQAQPAILRFASDTFMEDLLDVVSHHPQKISEWVARPETWREPMPTPKLPLKPRSESVVSYLFNKTKHSRLKAQPASKKQGKKLEANLLKEQAVPVPDVSKDLPLKLYQSAHQRYYLVSASLLENGSGYPERSLNLSQNERSTFVVRRLVPPEGEAIEDTIDPSDQWDEYAFVLSPTGGKWHRMGPFQKQATQNLVTGEEQLPLFPVNYGDACRHQRSLHCGLIPVGKREVWMAASASSAIGDPMNTGLTEADPAGPSKARLIFQTDIAEPWHMLLDQAHSKGESLNFNAGDSDEIKNNHLMLRTARDQIQTTSWYILLDFAKFLEQYLPELWALVQGQGSEESLSDNEKALYRAIQETRLSIPLIDALVDTPGQSLHQDHFMRENPLQNRHLFAKVAASMRDGLLAIRPFEGGLEAVETAFIRYDENSAPLAIDDQWPDFLFSLADPQFEAPLPPEIEGIDYGEESGLSLSHAKIDALAELIERILPKPSDTEEIFPSEQTLDSREAWFVVRCVYERPHCGPLFPALLSHPTQRFQMAPFFDPDAPARPVRIPMPVDISPAGLRKFKKNTGFILSDMLCGKIKKIRKITLGDLVLSVLPWPFHKDLPNLSDAGPCQKEGLNFGMICSLSIPIVTLCAFIILMIMVSLFDLFFRWIPYFFICFPIPGFRAKKS